MALEALSVKSMYLVSWWLFHPTRFHHGLYIRHVSNGYHLSGYFTKIIHVNDALKSKKRLDMDRGAVNNFRQMHAMLTYRRL